MPNDRRQDDRRQDHPEKQYPKGVKKYYPPKVSPDRRKQNEARRALEELFIQKTAESSDVLA